MPANSAVPVVVDLAEPPVHDLGRVVDRAAGRVGERLVAEADAEHRHLGAPEHVERDADVALVLRAPGAGRDHDVVHGQRRDLLPRQLVVAHDDRLVAVDLAQQVEEVEGERVVVVDQERAHRPHLHSADLGGRGRAHHRDRGDDDQPGRQRQLRRDGRRVGRGADRDQALPGHADAAQPARDRRGGREPDRRHPALQPGGARRPAPADPSGGERRGRGAGRCLLVARGARGGDRRERAARPGQHGGGRRRQRPRVPRLQPRAPRGARGVDPRLARAHARRPRRSAPSCDRLQVLVDKTGGPREREAMDYVRRQALARAASASEPHRSPFVSRRPRACTWACSRSPATARGASAASACRSAARRSCSRRSPPASCPPRAPDAERALTFARRCHDALGLTGGAHLRVIEAIPQHVGLGSGTKLALAVAQALAALDGRDARRAGPRRGGGAGRAVGGGHVDVRARRPRGRGRRTGRASSARRRCWRATRCPTEWRAVLVVPAAEPGLSGGAEEEAFGRLAPAPERSAAIAQLVLTSLLPALVERELEEFGAALTRIQELVGDSFAAAQGGRFHPRAGALVEALLRFGAAGAGQSSWGPAVYGVVGSEAAGRELARRMEDSWSARAASSSWRSTTAAPAWSGHEAARERRRRRRGARGRRGGRRHRRRQEPGRGLARRAVAGGDRGACARPCPPSCRSAPRSATCPTCPARRRSPPWARRAAARRS